MAEIAVSFAAKMLAQVIGGAVLDEIKHLRGVRDDVEWLHKELVWMKGFLLDAEQRSSSGDEIVKIWVREVTDTAYRAEDVAATLAARRFTIGDGAEDVAATSDSRSTGFWSSLRNYGSCCCITSTGFWSFVLNFGSFSWITSTGDGVGSPASRSYVPSVSHFKQLHEIGNDIKELKKEIVGIQQRRKRYGFINSNVESSSRENLIREMRRKPLFQNEKDVFGLENDKNRVMQLLYAGECKRYVIGIVGMGGIGKTTLARQVFKSISSSSRFPKLAWVDLSQNYIQNHSIHKLLYEIAKQVIPNSPSSESMRTEELSELLKTKLKDKRYLIVMDDMWETDVWGLVKDHLPDSKNGSRIIITTRNENVAEHPALHFPLHRMEGLDNVHSWDLFTHLVFEGEEQIRRDCIGELKDLAEELVHGCGGSPLALTVLGGLLAGKEKTYHAWQDVLGNRKWLRGEHGKNCLDILKLSYKDLPHHLKWCFLYLSAFPEDHKIDVDKLIRLWVAEGFVANTGSNDEEDIARTYLEALKQRCLVRVFEYLSVGDLIEDYEYCRIHDLIRELIIGEAKEANFMNSEIKDGSNRAIHRFSIQGEISSFTCPSLRTLLNLAKVRITNFKHFNLLRVLDLEGAEIDKLPEEVGDMILLRYLSIKGTECRSLPNTISRLSYLETLDCRHSFFTYSSIDIPDNVWKMKTLKHILGVTVERQVGTSHLVKLQTLVGFGSTPDFVHSLLSCVFSHLRVLTVSTGRWENPIPLPMDIWKVMGSWPFLKFLELQGFDMKDVVCDKHGFPHLQRFDMNTVRLDSWEVERGSMPSLEIITVFSCRGLKRLPNGLAHCKKLYIIQCGVIDYELVKWYKNGIKDEAWEFHYVKSIEIR